MNKTFTYIYENIEYTCIVTYRKTKKIIFRYSRNGEILISCSRWVTLSKIKSSLKEVLPKLLKKVKKRIPPINEDYIYLFGEKVDLRNRNQIEFNTGKIIKFHNLEDLEKKLKIYFIEILKSRQKYYEFHMSINPPYKVYVRKMTTRYGTNSKKRQAITYNFELIHYSFEIIDCIIVHELAHEFIRNHSKEFYNLVYKHYPNYKEAHDKLRKGIFK